uniref:Uncharacterized protein n=1 Tax=Oryza brachyantha TaxID=4533 RepID=J3KV28_ORYBR
MAKQKVLFLSIVVLAAILVSAMQPSTAEAGREGIRALRSGPSINPNALKAPVGHVPYQAGEPYTRPNPCVYREGC